MASLDYTSECTYEGNLSIVNPYNFSTGLFTSNIIDVSTFYRKTLSICAYGGGTSSHPPAAATITNFFINQSSNPAMTGATPLDAINIVGLITDMNISFEVMSISQQFAKISFFDSLRYIQFGFNLTTPSLDSGIDARVISFVKMQSTTLPGN